VALAIVIFEKQMNRVKKGVAPALPAGPTNEEKLLIDIRDAIRSRGATTWLGRVMASPFGGRWQDTHTFPSA